MTTHETIGPNGPRTFSTRMTPADHGAAAAREEAAASTTDRHLRVMMRRIQAEATKAERAGKLQTANALRATAASLETARYHNRRES